MNKTKELRILITEEDKFGQDISKMSNFFKLLEKNQSSLFLEDIYEFSAGKVAIINEVLRGTNAVINDGYYYMADFGSLPKDILQNLKNGIYSIGESRQVVGNMRPVILDERGVRIKDITLKKVSDRENVFNSLQNLAIQMQLYQINERLKTIEALQEYQIESARKTNLVVPFLDARDFIYKAQTDKVLEKRESNLDKAEDKLTTVINAVCQDIQTTLKHLKKTTDSCSLLQNTSLIHKYIDYISEDIFLLTKYVGFLIQIFDYLDNKEKVELTLKKYQWSMKEFVSTPIGKNDATAVMLMQEYSVFNERNLNFWHDFGEIMKSFLQLNNNSVKEIYLIGTDDE